MNTLGDLRGTFAAVERINSILSATEIDESLAYGLDKEIQSKELEDVRVGSLYSDGYSAVNQTLNMHYMSALRSANEGCSLAWSGDICLEGTLDCLYPETSDSLF